MKIYIEAGANDGLFQSCTYDLEKTNEWKGILIEPNPVCFKDLIKNRSSSVNQFFNCALVSFEYTGNNIEFFEHQDHSAMGSPYKRDVTSYNNSYQVPCRTLQSILDELEIKAIDRFYLDVEGYELPVLQGIDFTKTNFLSIEVEVHSKHFNQWRDTDNEETEIIQYLKNFFNSYEIKRFSDRNTKIIFTNQK